MLQPRQLDEVSARYPKQIAELRDFLLKSGSVPAMERSLPAILHRLQHDRAFHRDLTSHLWVVIHLAHRDLSYADLLGILAIAAAGPQFAAQAHEDDAHTLLRFVMEARSALNQDRTQGVTPLPVPPVRPLPLVTAPIPPPQPIQPVMPREEEPRTWQTRPSPTQFSALDDEEPEPSRKPIVWTIAVCVLLALSFGLFFHFRNLPNQPASSTPEPAPAVVASEPNPTPPASETTPPTTPETVPTPTHILPIRKHLSTRSRTPPPSIAVAAAAPPITRPATTQPATARTSPPITTSASPRPVPATTPPSEPDRTHIALTTQPPRLVRRTPEQRAELNPTALNTTVHATTLGPGASSVVYSPVPAYPPAAASAHVQGEVRIQASVDHQGNVSSVRVISGPPLLREAALEAAQRWRFRPNLEAGESAFSSAITVFAFQLP